MEYSLVQYVARAWIGLPALLLGCASSAGLAPHEHALQVASGTAVIAWPRDDWWTRYGDPQLDALVTRATRDNPDLHLAQARIDRAQALAGIAGSGTGPQIGLDGSFQRTRFTEQQFIPPPFAGNWYWNNALSLNLRDDLDLWGARHAMALAALDRARATAVAAREARLNLQTALVQVYVRWSAAIELRALVQDDLTRQRQLLSIARQRRAAGLGSELEVQEATTALPDTRAQRIALDDEILQLRHQMAKLCGQPPAFAARLRPPRLRPNALAAFALPDTLPADLLGHRPDVAARRWAVVAAGRGIAAAKARFYPDINLSAFVGFTALDFSRLISGSAGQYGAGPAISLPIFDSGRLRSGLRGADADYDAAVDAYNATVLRALRQTVDAVETLRHLDAQLQQADRALTSADEAWRQARRGYRAGLTNQITVLHAQASLLAQQRRRIALQARRQAQYATLMQSLGGGFDAAAPSS